MNPVSHRTPGTAVPLGGWHDDTERAAYLAARENAAQAGQHAAFRHWLDWTPGEFDSAAKPVQVALFAEPDRYGTPDLFDCDACTCCQAHTYADRNPDGECPRCGHLYRRHGAA